MKETKSGDSTSRRRGSYRSEINLTDCTIRDGGLIKTTLFDEETVATVQHVNSRINYTVIGDKTQNVFFSIREWKFCTENDIRRIVDDNDKTLRYGRCRRERLPEEYTALLMKVY